MKKTDELRLREFLLKTVPRAATELERDLWPAMLRRMENSEKHVPWFDWVLLGAVTACLLLAPQMIPMLLYQL